MNTRWIVVADSSKARIFKTLAGGKLEELETLTHPESRLPEQQMSRDRPGLAMDGAGQGRHGLEPSSDPKRQEAVIFSRIVADYLDKALSQQKYQQMVLFSAPSFLGMLREQVSKPVLQSIIREIPKNISAKSTQDIQNHLRLEMDK